MDHRVAMNSPVVYILAVPGTMHITNSGRVVGHLYLFSKIRSKLHMILRIYKITLKATYDTIINIYENTLKATREKGR